MKNIRITAALMLLTLLLISPVFTFVASAHRSGCHRWHSCPSDSGSYVCGDLGYYSECGGSVPATPSQATSNPSSTYTPPPHVPVITSKSINTDEPVPFSKIQNTTNREYPPYSKVENPGVEGTKRTTTEITYTDGVESSRKVVSTAVIKQPVNEVDIVGSRLKPVASISAISSTSKKDKFDIKGRASSNSIVVLYVGGKGVKRAVADSNGNFDFKNVKISGQNNKLAIYNRINNKESIISEMYSVNTTKKSITSDYAKLHSKN